MFLAKVIGQVVSTKKEEALVGSRLVMLRPLLADPKNPSKFLEGGNTIVAVDTLGAGVGEVILFAQGSSARQVTGLKSMPIDASVIGIVDSVQVLGEKAYNSGDKS
ncbi:EutN/CcmL family microcompartment protein [Puniceicoccaceae bacterium K14]|nr:EutN/CcmL family microcompartment protein [Puniceicoccaceae bacterium K14]